MPERPARTFADALLDVVQLLNSSRVPYALSGGVAMALYGLPRFTKDVDVLLLCEIDRIEDMFRPKFRRLAADVFEDVTGYVIEVYPAESRAERSMLDRARKSTLGPEPASVLDPTDWAALKLREARRAPVDADRHMADVRAVARIEPIDPVRLADVGSLLGIASDVAQFLQDDRP